MMTTMQKQAKLLRSVLGPTDAEVAAYEAQRAAILARLDAELATVQAEMAKRAKAGV